MAVYLMDGSAYIYRSFYANQNMTRSDGFSTNVLFGVLRMIFKIMREERPEYFGFILDGRGKNFRHRLYEAYKAHRDATPEPLAAQIDPLLEIIRAIGISVTVSEDCEADDCIASLAARLRDKNKVVILGADKDLKQCLHENVSIWDPSSKETRITTLDSFKAEYGFGPEVWPDYQAIIGDSSDNIPGVSGIGPKGAGTLLKEFAGLEAIEQRMPAVPPALRKKLEGHMQDAFMCRELTTLRLDSCPNVALENLAHGKADLERALSFLDKYELRSLHRELSSMSRVSFQSRPDGSDNGPLKKIQKAEALSVSGNSEIRPTEYERGMSNKKSPESLPLFTLGKDMEQGNLMSFTSTTTESEDTLFSLAMLDSLPKLSRLEELPVFTDDITILSASDFAGGNSVDSLGFALGSKKGMWFCKAEDSVLVSTIIKNLSLEYKVIVPDLKFLLSGLEDRIALRKRIEIGACLDLSLAAWLISPEEYAYGWQKLYCRWRNEIEGVMEEGKKQNNPSLAVFALADFFAGMLHGAGLDKLLFEMEQPLVPVLLDMQEAGIGINKENFIHFLQETEAQIEKLSAEIHRQAGMPFNIRSAKQLGDVLFTVLGLKVSGKTQKGQASTSEETLAKLSGKHPIIDFILEYRKLEKLRSTYLEPLPKLVDSKDRIHSTFNQSATATGRLSSSNPNLQNIPVRGPQGTRLRACFNASAGNLLVSADYSQIELRVLAHLSGDATMLESFRNNEDIHSRTASLLFDVTPEQVNPEQRRNAKTINFGLVYGMGAQSLAQDLNISLNEAKAFMARYFEHLTGLKNYFDAVEEEAKQHGFVTTMTGRRRACPEILSNNQQLRSRARRQAINTCIQGTAADIIKLAMLAVSADRELENLGATLVLQIHDELLLEVPKENSEAAGKRLAQIMSDVKPGGESISIPLVTEWGAGENWAKAH